MKFEYVNVRDRERKWFKRPENLFDIGKSSKERKAMQCSWGKFQDTEHFVRDRQIFEMAVKIETVHCMKLKSDRAAMT